MAILGNKLVAMMSGLAVAGVAGAAALFTLDNDAEDEVAAVVEAGAGAPPESVNVDGGADALSDPEDAELTVVADAAADMDTQAPAETDVSQDDANAISFSLGSLDNLRAEPLATLLAKVESVADVAADTKVWVAEADIARAPGAETIYHVKGPLTCGRIGCDLVVVGDHDGARKVFLQTVGESVSSPGVDTLVINEATPSAATWVFNGEVFEEQR